MSDESKHQGGGSSNTFVFGVLIGVMLTLLFTTKKGRKLLRAITDEAVDRLSSWEDMMLAMQKKVEEGINDDLEEDEETLLGERVEEDVKAIEPPHEKIEIDTLEEEEPIRSEMPEEKEIRTKEDLKERVVDIEPEEAAPLRQDSEERVKEEVKEEKAEEKPHAEEKKARLDETNESKRAEKKEVNDDFEETAANIAKSQEEDTSAPKGTTSHEGRSSVQEDEDEEKEVTRKPRRRLFRGIRRK